METHVCVFTSPIGALRATVDGDGTLVALDFLGHGYRGKLGGERKRCAHVIRELEEYFSGKRKHFALKLKMAGTDFQRDVWRELQRIPYGKTISYQELAQRVGRPKAVRAVGQANGRNPIPVVVPCHRVIGANGKLTGFGGGIPIKESLLELEGALTR